MADIFVLWGAVFSVVFGCFVFLSLLVTITPAPAILCFSSAWERSANLDESAFARSRYAFPTTIAPLILLYLHFGITKPTHRFAGEDYWNYLSVGDAVFVFGAVFVIANLVVGRAIIWPMSNALVLPTFLGLTACLLISLFFGLHRAFVGGNPFAIFPLSAGIGYAFGLYYLMKLSNRVRIFWWSIPAVMGWIAAGVMTVLVAISKTKAMVDRLPADPPNECFIVTAASRRGSETQLNVFREFERWLKEKLPSLHGELRANYNIVGPLVADWIRDCWLADATYFCLKPFEWVLRLSFRRLECSESVQR